MKIYTKIKNISTWLAFTEKLIKKHPDNQEYKKYLEKLKQQKTGLCMEIGNGISKNRTKFFKQNKLLKELYITFCIALTYYPS